MKTAFMVFLICATCVSANCMRIEHDSGPIELSNEGRIIVRGSRGEHVIEPLTVCAWCSEGLEVLLTFNGFTRATIQPFNNNRSVRPIKGFIIRDGRE